MATLRTHTVNVRARCCLLYYHAPAGLEESGVRLHARLELEALLAVGGLVAVGAAAVDGVLRVEDVGEGEALGKLRLQQSLRRVANLDPLDRLEVECRRSRKLLRVREIRQLVRFIYHGVGKVWVASVGGDWRQIGCSKYGRGSGQ